jgi:hypothetical protein
MQTTIAMADAASTMSRVVNRGNWGPAWLAEFEGAEETPSPSASTAITKYLSGSTSLLAPTQSRMSPLVPVNQVGNSTAFERSALSIPHVR